MDAILIYKSKRYAGIVWHVGGRDFPTMDQAIKYKTFFDQLRVSVNGLRWAWDADSVNHPHTATIRPFPPYARGS